MIKPLKNFSWKNCSQLFGVSENYYRQHFGIPGHNGCDFGSENNYGDPILAAHDGKVVHLSLSPTKGMGVYLETQENDITIRTAYWHMSEVLVSLGEVVKAGQEIGKMGNTGMVFPQPTPERPRAGTHLHFAVALYKNGIPLDNFNGGFVDPVPFLFKEGEKLPISLYRNLFIGRRGDDVCHLQTILALEKLSTSQPTGYFGNKTLHAIIELQKRYNIHPHLGYVGEKTRAFIHQKYKIA